MKDVPGRPPAASLPMDRIRSMTGLAQLQAMIQGKFPPPPMALTMNFHLAEAEEGRVVFRGTPTGAHYNPLGTIHGGWQAALLDSALGCAVHSMLAPGTGFTTMEFKVNLVRPLSHESGELTCTGRVIHFGRRSAISDASIWSPDGKLVAHGTETCTIFPLPDGA